MLMGAGTVYRPAFKLLAVPSFVVGNPASALPTALYVLSSLSLGDSSGGVRVVAGVMAVVMVAVGVVVLVVAA